MSHHIKTSSLFSPLVSLLHTLGIIAYTFDLLQCNLTYAYNLWISSTPLLYLWHWFKAKISIESFSTSLPVMFFFKKIIIRIQNFKLRIKMSLMTKNCILFQLLWLYVTGAYTKDSSSLYIDYGALRFSCLFFFL